DCGLIDRIIPINMQEIEDDMPLQPSKSIEYYTVGNVLKIIASHGASGFIPEFDVSFKSIDDICDSITHEIMTTHQNTMLSDLTISLPDGIQTQTEQLQ
ncbi:MAG: hypothetical protein K2O30_10965, partial [Duncaniella sp.]|nr:hypothetical protein [Duncaniella sp.]